MDTSGDVGVKTVEVKAIKITNPLYLGQIALHIKDFNDIVKVNSITYESLYTYFTSIVQFGGNFTEFWVVFEGDKPAGFASWVVRGLPHISTVLCDYVYIWTKNPKVGTVFMEEFIKFGKKHRAVLYEGIAINETLFRLYRKRFKQINVAIEPKEHIFFIGREGNENTLKDSI